MRPGLAIPLILAAAAVGGCAAQERETPAPAGVGDLPPGERIEATVPTVIDGDTIHARFAGERYTVRLLGIDTPETGRPNVPVQCFGPESTAGLERLLPSGTRVTLVIDPTQDREDRFGRLLAYVFRAGDAASVNEEMIAGGFARAYVVGRPFELAPRFRRAEREARDGGRGLWGACGAFPRAPPAPGSTGRVCPPGLPVKGNLPSGIYHVPGSPSYEETNPERCFATPADAERAGFRPPRG